VRIAWAEVPDRVRREIERRLGSPVKEGCRRQ